MNYELERDIKPSPLVQLWTTSRWLQLYKMFQRNLTCNSVHISRKSNVSGNSLRVVQETKSLIANSGNGPTYAHSHVRIDLFTRKSKLNQSAGGWR